MSRGSEKSRFSEPPLLQVTHGEYYSSGLGNHQTSQSITKIMFEQQGSAVINNETAS